MTSAHRVNPFIQSAQPLLAAGAQLRTQALASNLPALGNSLVHSVLEFEKSLRTLGVPHDDIVAARYLLCTFVDDVASATPWGGADGWSPYSLLRHFHQEAWGGERVFLLLSRLAETPENRREVLELFHVCLSLGLEGKYRGVPGGERQIQEIRARLFQLLSQAPGLAAPTELSGHWQAAKGLSAPNINGLPLWALLSVIVAVVAACYIGFDIWLARASDQAFASMRSIRFGALPEVDGAAAADTRRDAVITPRLRRALEEDLREHSLGLQEGASQSVVTIPAEALFEPGSARLTAQAEPLLRRVAAALAAQAGPILVSGHVDASAGHTALFPSAWHLTDAQARAVAKELRRALEGRSIQAEGRGDTELPAAIVEGAAPAGAAGGVREANATPPARRIEIALFPGR